MNVLPFILTFIFIFGMFSISYLENYRSFHSEQQTYLTSMESLRICRNKQELRNYEAAQEKSKRKKGTKRKEKGENKKSINAYDREKYFGTTLSKVNLSPLLNEKENETLYTTALRYFQKIYGHVHFIKDEKFAKKIFDAFLNQAKSKWKLNQKVYDFPELYPEDPKLHFAYYKILKGTQSYDISKGKGYPPLSDLFLLENPIFVTKPINFYHIPYGLIEVLYGEKIMERIRDAEQTKKSSKVLTQDAYEKILHSDHNSKQNLIDDFLYYTYDKDLKPRISSTNRKTGITIRL